MSNCRAELPRNEVDQFAGGTDGVDGVILIEVLADRRLRQLGACLATVTGCPRPARAGLLLRTRGSAL